MRPLLSLVVAMALAEAFASAWFDVGIATYETWPADGSDVQVLGQGTWTGTQNAVLRDSRLMVETLAADAPLTFNPAVRKSTERDELVYSLTTWFAVGDLTPAGLAASKCGVTAAEVDGVVRYYGLAKGPAGGGVDWVALEGATPDSERDVNLTIRIRRKDGRSYVRYEIDGAVLTADGNEWVEIADTDGMSGAVTFKGTSEVAALSAGTQPCAIDEEAYEIVKTGADVLLLDDTRIAMAKNVLIAEGTVKLNPTGRQAGKAAEGEIRILDGARLDLNQDYGSAVTFAKCEATHGKTIYVEGAGPDGLGAIYNSNPAIKWGAPLSHVVLTGDALVGGAGHFAFRPLSGSRIVNPLVEGGYTLTVSNDYVTSESLGWIPNFNGCTFALGGLNVCGKMQFEGEQKGAITNGVRFANGSTLRLYGATLAAGIPLVAEEGATVTMTSDSGASVVRGALTVGANAMVNFVGAGTVQIAGTLAGSGAITGANVSFSGAANRWEMKAGDAGFTEKVDVSGMKNVTSLLAGIRTIAVTYAGDATVSHRFAIAPAGSLTQAQASAIALEVRNVDGEAVPNCVLSVADRELCLETAARRVETAVWTGGGDIANLADPANWACTNGTAEVADGLPMCETHVVIPGGSVFNCPPGAGFTFADIVLPDSLAADTDWRGLGAGLALPARLDLNGHELKVFLASGKSFPLYSTEMMAGMLTVTGDGTLVLGSASARADAMTLDLACVLSIQANSTVGSLTLRGASAVSAASGKSLTVKGAFAPVGNANATGIRMADGSTLDLSQAAFEGPLNGLSYASGATVTVDLGARRVKSGTKLLGWVTQPEGITFKVKGKAARELRCKPDGLYLINTGFLIQIDGHVASCPAWPWAQSREAVCSWFLDNVYGVRPAAAEGVRPTFAPLGEDKMMMDGAAVRRRVTISTAGPLGTHSFTATAFLPSAATDPVPAFLLICNRDPAENLDPERIRMTEFWPAEEIVRRGYAAIAFYNGEIAPDADVGCRQGVFTVFEPSNLPRAANAWGTLSAWAWGASRVLDWLETVPEVDARRVAVIGHSRGGKTALIAGVTDPRFALVCMNESGCTGAKLNLLELSGSEHIADIVKTFPYWFCANYAKWVKRELEMPFDQHQWMALVSPRPLAVGSASSDTWSGPKGEEAASRLARMAWEDPTRVDYHIRPGGHDLTLVDWTAYMDFADRVLQSGL